MADVRKRRWRMAMLVLCGALLPACGGTTAAKLATVSARGLPLADVAIQRGGQTVLRLTVELAEDRATQERGLMGVRHLDKDQGMAFLFDSPVSDGFWMKDTLIPLDIVFVDGRNRVVDVQNMVPCTADPCSVYYASRLYTTAIETGSGVLTAAGVAAGDTVTLTRRAPKASATP